MPLAGELSGGALPFSDNWNRSATALLLLMLPGVACCCKVLSWAAGRAFMTNASRCRKKCKSALGCKPACPFACTSASVLAGCTPWDRAGVLIAWQNVWRSTAGSWGLKLCRCDMKILSSACRHKRDTQAQPDKIMPIRVNRSCVIMPLVLLAQLLLFDQLLLRLQHCFACLH